MTIVVGQESAHRLSASRGAEPQRSDSRITRDRLVNAVGDWVDEHGEAPSRLADLAVIAGLSIATAYRHFGSLEDAIRDYVLRLPQQAAVRFARSDSASLSATDRFHLWNRCWVRASVEQGLVAVHLRSPIGFLHRRAEREPTVAFVCDHVEPLIVALTEDPVRSLVIWNAVSDPREVLDLRATLRWSQERVARFITDSTLAGQGGVRHAAEVR